ncbi:hypothetical protein AAGS61_13070 [Lysinibacillus sp. KU-BSD001]
MRGRNNRDDYMHSSSEKNATTGWTMKGFIYFFIIVIIVGIIKWLFL